VHVSDYIRSGARRVGAGDTLIGSRLADDLGLGVADKLRLDTATAAGVFTLFRRINRECGCAVLVVTHDPRLSGTCDRTIELVDGRIVGDRRHSPDTPRAAA
jgi:ABC-type dipeptide/oligopeptide/nickel transport system ATPase component